MKVPNNWTRFIQNIHLEDMARRKDSLLSWSKYSFQRLRIISALSSTIFFIFLKSLAFIPVFSTCTNSFPSQSNLGHTTIAFHMNVWRLMLPTVKEEGKTIASTKRASCKCGVFIKQRGSCHLARIYLLRNYFITNFFPLKMYNPLPILPNRRPFIS